MTACQLLGTWRWSWKMEYWRLGLGMIPDDYCWFREKKLQNTSSKSVFISWFTFQNDDRVPDSHFESHSQAIAQNTACTTGGNCETMKDGLMVQVGVEDWSIQTPNWSMLLHFVSCILVHLARITSNHLEIHIQAIPRVPGKLSHDCLEIWRPCLTRWSPWKSFTAGHGNTTYDFHGSHKVRFESRSRARNLHGTFKNLEIPVDLYSDLGVGADTIILAQFSTEAKESNLLSNHFVVLHLFTTSTNFRKCPEPHGTARLHPQRPSIRQVESKGWFLYSYSAFQNSSHLTSNKIYIIYILRYLEPLVAACWLGSPALRWGMTRRTPATREIIRHPRGPRPRWFMANFTIHVESPNGSGETAVSTHMVVDSLAYSFHIHERCLGPTCFKHQIGIKWNKHVGTCTHVITFGYTACWKIDLVLKTCIWHVIFPNFWVWQGDVPLNIEKRLPEWRVKNLNLPTFYDQAFGLADLPRKSRTSAVSSERMTGLFFKVR